MSILSASVSGMLANTSWLSSISQNVANANTTGYKRGQTMFQTLVDQASDKTESVTGVTTSLRSLNTLQGSVLGTSSTTDLAVQGSGFFVVSNASGDVFLTRNGSFVPDARGDLVNSAGYYLMGFDVRNGANVPSNSLSGLTKVSVSSSGLAASPTSAGTMSVNLPSAASIAAAGNLPSTNSATAQYAGKTSLVVYDNLGNAKTLDVYFAKTAANTWETSVYDASTATNGGFPYGSAALATQALNFDPANGKVASGSPISLTIPGGQAMSLDLSTTTQLAAGFGVFSATANGYAPSTLSGVSIGSDGTLAFKFANGVTTAAFEIPLADVPSPDNLLNVNGNAFQPSYESGQVFVGSAGAGGLGMIQSSALENSTVDLATELTDMIQAQSAYQANSKVFQTGATLLDVLNGLKA